MKSVFITGGSTGIGRAAVKKFVQENCAVTFMDLNTEAAAELCAELNSEQVQFVRGDTKIHADIRRAAQAAGERFGGIDVVFCNAGIHHPNTVLNITDEELDLIIHTNIYGTVNTLRTCVPMLIERGGGAVVINASDQVFIGKAHSFAYGLTKGALGQITKSLSVDLGPYHIRVNAICPGTIATPLVDRIFEQGSAQTHRSVEDYWQEENALFARGRAGTAEEVAELVYFLASDKADFCTGGLYPIDGGLSAGL